jgi:hypothetical protein
LLLRSLRDQFGIWIRSRLTSAGFYHPMGGVAEVLSKRLLGGWAEVFGSGC